MSGAEYSLDQVEGLAGAVRPDHLAIRARRRRATRPPSPAREAASTAGEGTTYQDVARVSHFVATDTVTRAIVGGREDIVEYALAEVETLLDSQRLIRTQRSSLVNIAAVRDLDRWVDAGMLVRLKGEAHTELPVAHDRVSGLKERLGL